MKFSGFISFLVPRVSEITNSDHLYSFSMVLALTRVVDSRTEVEALRSGGGLARKYPLFGPRIGVKTPGSGGGLSWLHATTLLL